MIKDCDTCKYDKESPCFGICLNCEMDHKGNHSNYEIGKVVENKQKICNLLCKTLQETRSSSKLLEIKYNEGIEVATLVYEYGAVHVNVACDSGSAMIRDIMKRID